MDTQYYCVKEAGECKGQCDICPQRPFQEAFPFMDHSVEDAFDLPKEEDPIEVTRPAHYTMGKIEVYDFISAWDLSFAEGNVVKYVTRSPYKGRKLEDLQKARWYLDQLIKEAK